jgi:7-cyano-7-deazaguanine synthase
MPTAPEAVILLSGGLDSTTLLAIARAEGYALNALTFDYGQRHKVELRAAAAVARAIGVRRHAVVPIDAQVFAGSALTDAAVAVPKDRDLARPEASIPVTYVPARNTIFLAYALAWAEVLGAQHLFIGVNALDYSGYPDCRPEFIAAFERLANLATKAAVEGGQRLRIHTPLIQLTKAQIVARGLALGVDYAHTSTCYDPDPEGRACGHCDACQLRLAGFRANGIPDPAPYR